MTKLTVLVVSKCEEQCQISTLRVVKIFLDLLALDQNHAVVLACLYAYLVRFVTFWTAIGGEVDHVGYEDNGGDLALTG